ncbi:MAG: ABC transporter permease [Erysipelotrichaceae bacterium]|nr:ABC transporter permease [Erysipelotrichaceae bacterium]
MSNIVFAVQTTSTWEIIKSVFPLAFWETLYVTLLATLFAMIIGVPLGIILVIGDSNGIRPLPKWFMNILNVVINLLRSVPFLILIIVVMPLTRLIVGTVVGTVPSIVPLVIASSPYVARVTEASLREVDSNVIEMAQSMGATPFQIITKVMIPESVPSLLADLTITLTNVLSYTAMSGALGGGGLGKIAIDYGYYRYRYDVMILAVVLLIVMVQLFQTIGTKLSIKSDKRLRNTVN